MDQALASGPHLTALAGTLPWSLHVAIAKAASHSANGASLTSLTDPPMLRRPNAANPHNDHDISFSLTLARTCSAKA